MIKDKIPIGEEADQQALDVSKAMCVSADEFRRSPTGCGGAGDHGLRVCDAILGLPSNESNPTPLVRLRRRASHRRPKAFPIPTPLQINIEAPRLAG